MMRFKIDENLPEDVAAVLREAGHDAATFYEQQLSGAGDGRIAEVCRSEGRALITFDIGFADIRRYPPSAHDGIVVLRLERQDVPHVLGVVHRLLSLFDAESLGQRLWIVDEERVRIRQ